MAGRALAFGDRSVIKLLNDEFVAVATDDWYTRRRRDATGDFFRSVADLAGRTGPGGGTRQGYYCFSASGKLLATQRSNDAKPMKAMLQQAVRKFGALRGAEWKPGAVTVPDHGPADKQYTRTPPAGGLILRAYTRIVEPDGKGGYAPGKCDFTGGDQAARDHVWLRKDEVEDLIPERPKVGASVTVPEAVVRRLCRYHLVDNTRGEPDYWKPEEVRKASLAGKVVKADDHAVTVALTGAALLATDADPDAAARGYEATLRGTLRYDPGKKAVTAFDLMAVGDHWGRSTFTPGERPGRKPLGVVFELARGTAPGERIPPQAGRNL
ncbi:MAG: hypothetical protein ACRC33_26520, partial [Gemmataceae bacterium]